MAEHRTGAEFQTRSIQMPQALRRLSMKRTNPSGQEMMLSWWSKQSTRQDRSL
jgi:hypothetical protein